MIKATYHTKETAPAGSHPALEASEGKFGKVLNLYAVLAESPAAANGYVALSNLYDQHATMTPGERQIALLTISTVNGCTYCVPAHSGGAKKAGVSPDVIDAVRDGTPVPDAKMAALHAFSKALVEKRGFVSDEEVGAFKAAGFSEGDILDVIVAAAIKTLSNYAHAVFDFELDDMMKPLAWDGLKSV